MNTLAEPLAEPLAEHRRAVLTVDQPEAELIAAHVGVEDFIHNERVAYEVEFPNQAVLTLEADQVRALGMEEILHVRPQPPSPNG
ncbi:MAG: DUF4926 domain-containing protein [Gemmatimonadetes bacterium]|nr:DUF4926 domain-containing protein [Gemmatimonadota bacterium]